MPAVYDRNDHENYLHNNFQCFSKVECVFLVFHYKIKCWRKGYNLKYIPAKSKRWWTRVIIGSLIVYEVIYFLCSQKFSIERPSLFEQSSTRALLWYKLLSYKKRVYHLLLKLGVHHVIHLSSSDFCVMIIVGISVVASISVILRLYILFALGHTHKSQMHTVLRAVNIMETEYLWWQAIVLRSCQA